MIYKANKIYIGRLWYYDSLEGECKPVSDQIRIFYLTKYQFNYLHRTHPAFKDIISGRYFPINIKNIICDPFLVPFDRCLSLKQFLGKELIPECFTYNSLLELYKLIYKTQLKEYENKNFQSEEESISKKECNERIFRKEEK